MPSYYDDNFGEWDGMDDEDMRDFYMRCQRESVSKKCQGCGRTVRIRPEYAYCNTCADARERGMDF
jgi:hypothetical protein